MQNRKTCVPIYLSSKSKTEETTLSSLYVCNSWEVIKSPFFKKIYKNDFYNNLTPAGMAGSVGHVVTPEKCV